MENIWDVPAMTVWFLFISMLSKRSDELESRCGNSQMAGSEPVWFLRQTYSDRYEQMKLNQKKRGIKQVR